MKAADLLFDAPGIAMEPGQGAGAERIRKYSARHETCCGRKDVELRHAERQGREKSEQGSNQRVPAGAAARRPATALSILEPERSPPGCRPRLKPGQRSKRTNPRQPK